jgi:opacity protein-like surface antigen
MGWVKHSRAAGFVALCGALASAAAQAAELPPLPEAPALPPAESAGNWYVRGDFGAASYSTSRWTQAPDGLVPGDQVLAAGFTSKSIRDPAFVGAGFGYELHPWVRADITAEYRASIKLHGIFQERVLNPSVPLAFLGQNELSGSLQTSTVMANAYADLGTWYGFTPYLGAGIGLARHLSGVSATGAAFIGSAFDSSNVPIAGSAPTAFAPTPQKTRTNVAWSIMAGLSYSMSRDLKLDLGYRRLDLGDIQSGAINCLCRESSLGFQARNVASNEIRVGIRWAFAEAGLTLGASDDLPEVPR